MSALEILAVFCTVGGIALTARRFLFGWPLSLIAALLYLVIFARAGLYADAGLQILFCLFLLRGWWEWYAVRALEEDIPVRMLSCVILLRDLAIGCCTSIALGLVLRRWTEDVAPMTDAALSVFSLIGQFWTGRRYRACWVLWICVDSVYIALFLTRGLYLTSGLYAGLTGLAFWGWHAWRPDHKSASGS